MVLFAISFVVVLKMRLLFKKLVGSCKTAGFNLQSVLYTGEHLKRHTAGVLCLKSSPIPHNWRFKTCRFKSSTV